MSDWYDITNLGSQYEVQTDARGNFRHRVCAPELFVDVGSFSPRIQGKLRGLVERATVEREWIPGQPKEDDT